MSEGLFARLPRFDEEGPAGSHLMDEAEAPDTEVEPVENEDAIAAREARERANEQLAAIETTLGALADAVEEANERTRAQTTEMMTAVAQSLFPELSRLFLAEEIGRHLPGLIPGSAVAVEVRAEADLAESLRDVVQKSDRLGEICKITEDEEAGQDRVEVSWTAGGVTFDFASLLDASLERLRGADPTTEDQANG